MSKNEDIKNKIDTDEDFINYPKFSNSLRKLMSKYPDGVDDEVIAKALMISKDEVEEKFMAYVSEARKKMGLTDDK